MKRNFRPVHEIWNVVHHNISLKYGEIHEIVLQMSSHFRLCASSNPPSPSLQQSPFRTLIHDKGSLNIKTQSKRGKNEDKNWQNKKSYGKIHKNENKIKKKKDSNDYLSLSHSLTKKLRPIEKAHHANEKKIVKKQNKNFTLINHISWRRWMISKITVIFA